MAFNACNCPNCGASFNPSTNQCGYCGSFIITSNANFTDLSQMKMELPQKPREDGKYPGIYVFGRLLGQGERPITLGSANYMTGKVAAGGKLLLTNMSLSFSAHAFNAGRQETKIFLRDVTDVHVKSNMLISQKICVTARDEKHEFVVYHGNEWVQRIKEAAAHCPKETIPVQPVVQPASAGTTDYIVELERLKRLVDIGVITAEEFEAKKKSILGM